MKCKDGKGLPKSPDSETCEYQKKMRIYALKQQKNGNLIKQASLEALRKKQYWGILKRLHGGNEEAIKAVKDSGDSGVYHGSKVPAKDLTSTNVLPASENALFGKGAYFGSKGSAGKYQGAEGSLVRLKKPSELTGTKLTYPNINQVRNTDLKVNPRLADKDIRKFQTYGPGADDVGTLKDYRAKHTGGEPLPIGWDDVKYKNRTLLDKARYTQVRKDLANNPGKKSMFQDFAKMEHTSLNQKLKNDIELTNPKLQPFAPTSEARVVFKKGVPGNLIKDTVEPVAQTNKSSVFDKIKNIFKTKGE